MKYFKLLVFSLLSINITLSVNAKVIHFEECTFTEEYKQYLQLSKEEQAKMRIPTKCIEEQISSNYIGASSSSNDFALARYDLRDQNKVNTTLVNQEDLEICWAIGATESIQSSLLKEQNKNYDLSEAHIDLATQNTYNFNRPTFNRKVNSGGNYTLTNAYLYNHWGPILENQLTLDKDKEIFKQLYTPTKEEVLNPTPSLEVNQTLLLTQSKGACSSDTKTAIKKYLTEHGALEATVYMDIYGENFTNNNNNIESTFTKGAYYYYDGSAYTQYNQQSISANQLANHAVTIIGWDDNISKDSFSEKHKPTTDGAWIVKNSWGNKLPNGANAGDNGYYYISYEDIRICNSLAGYYDIELDNTDKTYNENNLSYSNIIKLQDTEHTIYEGGIFEKTADIESLNKITFLSIQPNTSYNVYYSNSSNLNNLTKIASGVVNHSGFTTVKISNPPKITNSKFAIVVEFNNSETIELAVLQSNDAYFKNVSLTEGKTFISTDKTNWSDTVKNSDIPFQIPLYAYTNDVQQPCSTKDNRYYDDESNEVNEATYKNKCNPKCQMKNDVYYDNAGNIVDENNYNKLCATSSLKCTKQDDKYYDDNGNIVEEATYKNKCNPKCQIKNNIYYDNEGNEVSKDDYNKKCNNDENTSKNNTPLIQISNNVQNNSNNTSATSEEIENPNTGSFLSWLLIPLFILAIYIVRKTRKNKFYKI